MMKRTNTNSSTTTSQVLEADFLSKTQANSELIKRLKIVTETLESYTDEDEVIERAKQEIENLAAAVGSSWLIDHKNKDVRLLVACALADVLRIYAPDPPYDEDTSVAVIRLFLKILRGFESPDMTPQHPSYRSQLLKELAEAAYSISCNMVTHGSANKVIEHLTAILCCVIEEMESYDLDLFDLVVGALCKNEKKENPAGWSMMKSVIASCENHFQPFIERQIHQVKAGYHLESELTNGERLAEAVFELSSIAPRVLTQVLPAYAEDLVIEDPAARIKAVKLLGAVFSVGNFSRDFGTVFAEFKRRSLDKDAEVRRTMVNVLGVMLQRRSELSKNILEDAFLFQGEQRDAPMYSLIVDSDEKIRKEAVECVLGLALNCPESVSITFLKHVAERTLDRRPAVRQATIEGICKLYQKFCAPFPSNNLFPDAVEKYGWIPTRIVTLISGADIELRMYIIRCLEEICFAVTDGNERSTTDVVLDFFSFLEEKGQEHIGIILRNRNKFQETFLKLVELRDGLPKRDLMDESGDREQASTIERMSQFFVDSSRASDMLQKLVEVKTPKVWESLVNLVRKPRGQQDTQQVLDDILRRMGPKSSFMEFVRQLVWKLSDKFFGSDFVVAVLRGIAETSEEVKSSSTEGLAVLVSLATLNPKLIASHKKDLKDAFLVTQKNENATQQILQVLVFAASELREFKNDEDILNKLSSACKLENFNIAKFSCRAILKLAGNDTPCCKAVLKASLGSLDFGPKLPSVLTVIAEISKHAPKLLKTSDHSKLVEFAKNVLKQKAGKKEKKLTIQCKARACKLICALILGLGSQHSKSDDLKLREWLSEIQEVVESGGKIGSDSASDAESSILRLTAASCILKIAKESSLRHLVSPRIFRSIAYLCEDDDVEVRRDFVKKVWKGTGVQHGRLPFHFAAILVLAAHDSDSGQLEFVKSVLKNVLALMKKLRTTSGKALLSIAPERILPWLIYLLSNHPKYLDGDEDDAQVSVSFKKYLEMFFNTLTQSGTDEKIFPILWQTIEHIRGCTIADDAISAENALVVTRNLRIICEAGKRLVTKFGGHKKWDSEVLRDHMRKIVDKDIFVEVPTSADAADGSAEVSTPEKRGIGSFSNTPASSIQKFATPSFAKFAVTPPRSKVRLFSDIKESPLPTPDLSSKRDTTSSVPKSTDKVLSHISKKTSLETPPRKSTRREIELPTKSSEIHEIASSAKPRSAPTSKADEKEDQQTKEFSAPQSKGKFDSSTGKRARRSSAVDVSPMNAASKSTLSKENAESPLRRGRLFSPGPSKNSTTSPRASTEVQVLETAKQKNGKGNQPAFSAKTAVKPSSVPAEDKKRKADASPRAQPDQKKKKVSKSSAVDVFDIDNDDFFSITSPKALKTHDLQTKVSSPAPVRGKSEKAKASPRGSKPNPRNSSPSPASGKGTERLEVKSPAKRSLSNPPKTPPRPASIKAAEKLEAKVLAASPASRTRQSAVAVSRAVVPKSRASASHEAPASALERLEKNLSHPTRAGRRRGQPPPAPGPAAEAPQPPKSRRRRL